MAKHICCIYDQHQFLFFKTITVLWNYCEWKVRRNLFYLLDYITSTESFQIGDRKKIKIGIVLCAVFFGLVTFASSHFWINLQILMFKHYFVFSKEFGKLIMWCFWVLQKYAPDWHFSPVCLQTILIIFFLQIAFFSRSAT